MNTTDKLAAADALADAAQSLSSNALGGDGAYLTIDLQDLAKLDAAVRRYRGKETCLACAVGDAGLGPQHAQACNEYRPY